jgi:drug/metabolite transporter (DMT)-like permease
MLGPIAALATAFCWSLTAIFFSASGRLVGSDVVNRSRLLFALLFIVLTHQLTQGSLFPFAAEPFRWGWLALSSILGLVLGDTFLFRAYVQIGPRLAMLMMSAVPIISALLASIFLSESVSPVEWLGIFVTVSGIGWVVTERQPGRTFVENKQYRSGLAFGLLGALGQASNLIAAKFGIVDGFATLSASAIRVFVAIVILWLLAGLRGQIPATLRAWNNRQALPAILAGTFSGPFLGIWLSLVAIQLTRIGIASTLMALPPVILIPLGRLIYKERVSKRGLVGTLVAFAGVALLFLPV